MINPYDEDDLCMGMTCPNCGWGWVTTNQNHILFDQQDYTLSMSSIEKPSVDIMDPDLSPAEILNTTTQKVAASYYRKAAESILADALKELSDEELHDVFTKLKTEQGRSFLTEDRFRNGLRDDDYSSFFFAEQLGQSHQ